MSKFNISYRIIAVDKFSKVGQKVAKSLKQAETNAHKLKPAVDRARDSLKKASSAAGKFGDKMKGVGSSLKGISVASAAFGANAMRLWGNQEKAVAKVEALIKSTGGTAGYTLQQLTDMASEMQSKTIFGDEDILNKATAQLLTFTNITGEQFAKTQQVALDLASTLDGDLQGASIMLGKALNDPVANLSALSRAGVQFSDEQKAIIKVMGKTGNITAAQNLILEELNKQYGGVAERIAQTDAGKIQQMTNAVGDLNEKIGAALSQYLTPLVKKITAWTESMQNASPTVFKIIAGLVLFAAVAAPILMTIGQIAIAVKVLTMAMAGLTIASTLVFAKFVLIAAVLAAGAYAWYTLWPHIKKVHAALVAIASKGIGLAVDKFCELRDIITSIWDTFKGFVTFLTSKALGALNKVGDVMGKVGGFFGFGGAPEIGATAASGGEKSSFTGSLDVNLNDPSGAVQSTQTKSNGALQLRTGGNM